MRIAFATYGRSPDITVDDALAADELRRRGADVVPLVWRDHQPEPDGFAAVVTRSCWDYHLDPGGFAAWMGAVERAGIRLLNPARLARWNLHKSYLRDLEARGIAVPGTVWVERGSELDLRDVLRGAGLDRAVVKPAVSLSAFETWRTSLRDAAADARRFAELVAARDVMVQAYVAEVETEGELSFVFLGGAYSHAVRKRPGPGDFRVQSDHGGTWAACAPPVALVEQAQEVVAALGEVPAFARIDGIDVGGRLVLMELELIDPVLFLASDSHAPARFADAVLQALA